MENSPRLCDILNLKFNKLKPKDFEKTNSAWELIKSLFIDNIRTNPSTSICFVVQKDKKIFFSINDDCENEVQLIESELLDCIPIGKLHGLTVDKSIPNDQSSKKFEDDVEYLIYFSFTPSVLN